MINVHDSDGNLIDPNPRLCEQTGYDREELLEMQVWDIDAAVDPDALTAKWAEMAVGDQRAVESEYERRDGSTFPVEVHLRRLDLNGDDRFVVISRDISERKARERRLRREKAQFEAFGSVVAHDLRNPLQLAKGRLQLARDDCDSNHLAGVANGLDRMGAIIDDVLVFAREHHAVDETDPVDLAATTRAAWDAVAVDAPASALTVDVETATATILAHESRLQRLLENLLRNALEHTGGPATVTMAVTDAGFAVADDGAGIPTEERETVFEAGYSTREGETGFGLAIVEQIADAHGWSVGLRESAAGGTRVEISGVKFLD